MDRVFRLPSAQVVHTQQIAGEFLVSRLGLRKFGFGLPDGEKLELSRRLGLRHDAEEHAKG